MNMTYMETWPRDDDDQDISEPDDDQDISEPDDDQDISEPE